MLFGDGKNRAANFLQLGFARYILKRNNFVPGCTNPALNKHFIIYVHRYFNTAISVIDELQTGLHSTDMIPVPVRKHGCFNRGEIDSQTIAITFNSLTLRP